MEEKFKTWQEIATTNRGLEEYLRDLHLTLEMLKGKKILDVGSGTRRFAKELKESGVNAEVISVDPVFASPEEKSRVQGDTSGKLQEMIRNTAVPGVREKTVAGVGEMLPFRDGTFDLVIADNSLPAYGNREQIDNFLQKYSVF
ncbi:MAG: class I SAM-dependent methyltransferase [Candidatus Sungbacteria bacterium]|nr:class I SAM-dependent methyltransferase [Candidatus Sungbacteria bacterium]